MLQFFSTLEIVDGSLTSDHIINFHNVFVVGHPRR